MILLTDNGPVEVVEPDAPAGAEPAPQLGFTWTGGDGVGWDLVRGPAWILSGARGFGMPTPQHWVSQSLLDGGDWNDLRFPPRDVYMPVELRASDIIETDRSFFAGLNPRTEGALRVTRPDGTWRELWCRYTEGADGEYELDPMLAGSLVYPIRLIAADPFWRGSPVADRFAYPSATPSFFSGPPFRLAPSNVLGESTVTNAGDVDAYPVARVEGPFTGFSVGVGDALVTMTLTKAAGEWVEIDGNRDRLTILDEQGTDLWDVASDVAFAPIPPGEVTLTTVVSGAAPGTAVTVSFTPRFFRAW